MSLADSVDEGDLGPYDFYDDWEHVEIEQRRRARKERLQFAAAIKEIGELETDVFIATELLAGVCELLAEKYREVAFLEDMIKGLLLEIPAEEARCPGG